MPTALAAPHLSDVDAAKRAARVTALSAREGCDPGWGTQLAAHVLDAMPRWPIALAGVVSGFWPMPGEIDIRPLLTELHTRGFRVALPVTPPRGNPLVFRAWTPDTAMQRERFGTFCPPAGAETLRPALLFVPLLAFDRTGRRLGYGGGYYDRTLPLLPGAVAVGCAFAAQELDAVPAADYDARLHAVATERGLVSFESE